MPGDTPLADLPYARLVDHPGGWLRRWLMFMMLRATMKRMRVVGLDIAALREKHARIDARLAKPHPRVHRTDVQIGDIAAHWLEGNEPARDRIILYLHGGAFMLRYPNTHAGMVAPWCEALRARALMVDYRLAPEHPFPAAPLDCHAAYRWLLDEGHDAGQIVIAGDSAGGNLALATLHAIKAAGEPMPACAVLLSPATDLTMSGASYVTHVRRDPMFSLEALLGLRSRYIQPEQMLDVRASPLFGDFHGFPPLYFIVGGREVLLDDSVRAAARAYAAGVSVDLEVWQHMAHVFPAQHKLPQAAAASERIVAFIARHANWPRIETCQSKGP